MGVMNISRSTKAFSTASKDEIPRDPGAESLSVSDKQALGDRDMGQVLNQIADPNWTDPAKKSRTVGNDKLDKDAFMKLMLAQMKNQDPSNPMQSHEMAAQLAQFSSVEQMQNMNTTLNEMKNAQKPSQQYQALNFIGKAVNGDSSKLVRAPGDKDHDFRFSIPKDVKTAKVFIKDETGEMIRSYDLSDLKKGENKVSWNGQDTRGLNARPGSYQFAIEAKDATGAKVAVKTDFDGIITGVNYTAEGPVLMIGTQTIRMADVKKISDPSLMKNDQNLKDVTPQDLKKEDGKGQTENNSAPSRITKDVGLSREMMNRLSKETATTSSAEEPKRGDHGSEKG